MNKQKFDDGVEQMREAFASGFLSYGAVCWEKAPSTGHDHLHVVIHAPSRPRMRQIPGVLPFLKGANFQFRSMKCTWQQSVNYLMFGDYDKSTRTGNVQNEHFFELGTLPTDPGVLMAAGSSTGVERKAERYSAAIVMAEQPGGLSQMKTTHPDLLLRHYSALKQISLSFPVPNIRDKLANYWIHGGSGSGKTSIVYEFCERYGKRCYTKMWSVKWWDHYQGEEVVLFDDVGPGAEQFADVWKTWTDWRKYPAEIKTGVFAGMRPQFMFFTSNFRMRDIFLHEKHLDPLQRRIKTYTVEEHGTGGKYLLQDKDGDPYADIPEPIAKPKFASDAFDCLGVQAMLQVVPNVEEGQAEEDLYVADFAADYESSEGSQVAEQEIIDLASLDDVFEDSTTMEQQTRPASPNPDTTQWSTMTTQVLPDFSIDNEDDLSVTAEEPPTLITRRQTAIKSTLESGSRQSRLDERGCVTTHYDSDTEDDDDVMDQAAQISNPRVVVAMILIRKEINPYVERFDKVFVRKYDDESYEFVSFLDDEPSFLRVGDAIVGVADVDNDNSNLVNPIRDYINTDQIYDYNKEFLLKETVVKFVPHSPSGKYMIDPAWRLFRPSIAETLRRRDSTSAKDFMKDKRLKLIKESGDMDF